MFLSRLRYFLISACVIGWLSGFGFPIKDGIYGVLISLNLFSKWFATVFRISFGFVISLPSLSSTLGFSNFPRLRALTAENITSSVCALLIASSCLFSSSFLSCVTFFLIWCSVSFLSFSNSIFLLSSFVVFILILSSFWRWNRFIFLVCGSLLCPTHVVVWLDGWGEALFVMNRFSLSQSSNNVLPFSFLLPFEYFPMLLSPSVNCPTLALKSPESSKNVSTKQN